MILSFSAPRPEQRWASVWLQALGIKEAWLEPDGARALVDVDVFGLQAEAEADLDLEAADGALMVRFAAARQKVLGASKVSPSRWWPGVKAKIEAAMPGLPPTVSLRVEDEERLVRVSLEGWRVEKVLILAERMTLELEPA